MPHYCSLCIYTVCIHVCICSLVNCNAPDEPMSGTIMDYNNIVTTEGSVISFQCDPGLTSEGNMTAICTNAGVWEPDPAGVDCSDMTS